MKIGNFLKISLVLIVILITAVLGLCLVGATLILLSDSPQDSPKALFINDQLPEKLYFSKNGDIVTNWTDGTKIKTLRNYKVVEGQGYSTEVTLGDYKFYKGYKDGQNVNQYYINSKYTTASQFSYKTKELDDYFYIEYDRAVTEDDGTIKNIYLKLKVEDYDIIYEDPYYIMNISKYSVEKSKNI